MSASELSGLTRSEINSAYIYAEGSFVESFIDECRQSGIEIAADDVHLVTYGKNLSIEIPAVREILDNSVSQLIVMHIENGYVHIFMLGAVNKLAVKDFYSVLNSFDVPRDNGEDVGVTYTDPDTGACFLVPDGWETDAISLEDAASYYQIEYTSQKDSGSSFLYGSADLWNTMSESRRSGHTRSEIDSAYIYEEWSSIESLVNLAPEQGITIDPADIHLVTHGKNEFIEIPEILGMAGIRIEASLFWLVEDGYIYSFTFLGTSDQATQDFHSVLSSLQVPAAETSGSGGTGSGQSDEAVEKIMVHLVNFVLFLVELGVTFLIYALPFVVYRNAIRKRPVGKKVLLIIIIVLYEFAAWVLLNTAMSWFLRRYANIFVPFFWGWYSYRKMVRRKDTGAVPRDESGSAVPQQPMRAAPPPAQQIPPAAPAGPAPYTPAPYAPAQFASQTPPAAPASPAPAAYIPAAPAPAAPAPQASPAAPASPASAAPVPQTHSFPQGLSSPQALSFPQAPSSLEAHIPVSPTPQTPPPAPRIQFCRKCGFRLLDDSKFCSVCGASIVPLSKE